MEQFASGWKQSYYGKGDVIVYRLHRAGNAPEGQSPVFGASVKMLVYGSAFWKTYTAGDNSGLVATDSMKNFIQRETQNYDGDNLADYCAFLATSFLDTYPQAEGAQVSAVEIPYAGIDSSVAFAPAGPDRATACVEFSQGALIEAGAGIRNFRLLRLGGSSFKGFVRDDYTTLPDIANRPLHMWLDVDWRFTDPMETFDIDATRDVRTIVHDVFRSFASGSIQQLIHQIGTRVLEDIPGIGEIHLEANNRTWDTIAEQGNALGIYTDARPPYGCLGLRLRR
jgi:urate oxidase